MMPALAKASQRKARLFPLSCRFYAAPAQRAQRSQAAAQPPARRTRAVDAEASCARHEQQQESARNADVLPEMNDHVALQGGVGDIPEVVSENGCRDRVGGHEQAECAD